MPITTGKTWHGNTAFGPSGGMAQGYATRSGMGSGLGPSNSVFSNFRTLSGAQMPGGNMAIRARNASQAYDMIRALHPAATESSPESGQIPAAPVTIAPTAQPMPPAPDVPLTKAMLPAFFAPRDSLKQQPAAYPTTFGPRNPYGGIWGSWPRYDGGTQASTTYAQSAMNNPRFGFNTSAGLLGMIAQPEGYRPNGYSGGGYGGGGYGGW